jgi:TolA-binding protein
MPKLVVLLLAFLLAQPGTRQPEGMPTPAEYPPQDLSTWSLVSPGLAKKLAARRLAESPASPETVRLLTMAENQDGMLRSLRLIVDTQPRLIADAFELVRDSAWRLRGDGEQVTHHREQMHRIIADARRRLPELPREEAARAEGSFMLMDAQSTERGAAAARLRRFVDEYRGTETALLAEVDLIGFDRVSPRMLDELDAFARAHPGTNAAAKALYQKGFQWHTINTLGTVVPRDADPIGRFERVIAVVEELESGRYPKSAWVDKAPELITGFFIQSDARMAPESIERFIDVFEAHAVKHFALDGGYPDRSGIGYVVTTKLGDLYERMGERTAGVERTLAMLERRVNDPAAVRLLRGIYYLRAEREETPDERAARLARAREVLRTLAAEGGSLSHRRALATLAALDFEEGRYETARAAYRRYVDSYPGSNWAWLARLRIGQCEEALGDPDAAAAAYLAAARAHGDLPPARVLGHEYAARALEAAGEFEKALAEHQRALAGWDNAFGLRYTTHIRRSSKPRDPFVPAADAGEVAKESLAPRIAQLKASLALPGGALLEQGRAFLSRGRHDEAESALKQLLAGHPESPAAAEGRYLLHRAALERALELANLERPDADDDAAAKALEELARQPHDFAVTAARVAQASLLVRRGEVTRAEALMDAALTAWHERQRIAQPAAGLERDVAAIRRVVFLPQGGEIYRSGRWNAFDFPRTPPSFMLVNADTKVKLPDGEIVRVAVAQPLDAPSKVLVFDTDQIAFLKKMIATLGGTKRREPGHVMETPNQPVGDSMQILGLWRHFFPARPGHWGGWEIETYPVVTEIEFTNAERTKAAARVTIGYSGATVELEKESGQWVAKRLTNQWIT